MDLEDLEDTNLDLSDIDNPLPSHATAPAPPTLSDPSIPPKLITTLLHAHFTHPDTRITKDAMVLLSRYVEVFAEEAVARACFGKGESGGGEAGGGGDDAKMEMDDDFLEVNDLEKLSVQLIVDF